MLNENPGNVQRASLEKIEEALNNIESTTPVLEYMYYALENARLTLDGEENNSNTITFNGEIGTIAMASNVVHSLGSKIDENVNALRDELEKLKQGED